MTALEITQSFCPFYACPKLEPAELVNTVRKAEQSGEFQKQFQTIMNESAGQFVITEISESHDPLANDVFRQNSITELHKNAVIARKNQNDCFQTDHVCALINLIEPFCSFFNEADRAILEEHIETVAALLISTINVYLRHGLYKGRV